MITMGDFSRVHLLMEKLSTSNFLKRFSPVKMKNGGKFKLSLIVIRIPCFGDKRFATCKCVLYKST